MRVTYAEEKTGLRMYFVKSKLERTRKGLDLT